jgi:hypothetical protein
MKDESFWLSRQFYFILPPSSFILFGRRSQVVRQRSAKPLFIGSIPIAASNTTLFPRKLTQFPPPQEPSNLTSFESN